MVRLTGPLGGTVRTIDNRRALCIVMMLVVMLGACTKQDIGGDDLGKVKRDIPDKKIEKVRDKIERENQPKPPPKQNGKIVLTVEDGTGLARPFIQVRVRSESGRTTTTLVTDAKGKARATVTAGTWFAEIIPGCQEAMNVTFADSRTLKVPAKGTAKATLRADATRRYMPGGRLRWDVAPPWTDERSFNLRVRWSDRCGKGFKAGEEFSKVVTVLASGRMSVHSYDTESDANGWVRIEISCGLPHGGTDGIWFQDRFNEADQVNVLSLANEPAGGWCA